ncbi:MAG TPA: C40 family peptidase [Gemmatimonadaceae bacterium]|nr:C40 family peptidase [Gemmatimonadaceae bacterium]
MPSPRLLGQNCIRLFEHTHDLLHLPSVEMPRRLRFLRAVVAMVAGALLVSAATVQAQDGVRTTPPVEETQSFSTFHYSALGDSIVELAREQLGKRYVFGGASPRRGFDCSGLVKYIASVLHIDVPRTARMQAHAGAHVAKDTAQLLPGDLLTFGRGSRISHIGIYVGNGRFIHASTKAGRVIETLLLRPPARGIKPWQGVRRLALADADSLTASELPLH